MYGGRMRRQRAGGGRWALRGDCPAQRSAWARKSPFEPPTLPGNMASIPPARRGAFAPTCSSGGSERLFGCAQAGHGAPEARPGAFASRRISPVRVLAPSSLIMKFAAASQLPDDGPVQLDAMRRKIAD